MRVAAGFSVAVMNLAADARGGVARSCRPVLVEHPLGHAGARALDVHMRKDLTRALVIALAGPDPAVHIRRALELAVLVVLGADLLEPLTVLLDEAVVQGVEPGKATRDSC
jgi:hypothetical protein